MSHARIPLALSLAVMLLASEAAHAKGAQPALPANNPAKWATPKDTPSWLMRGLQVVGVDIDVDPAGHVTNCRITQSAGGLLDDHTCYLIRSRARFKPARDDQGKPTAGIFSTRVRWQRY